MLHFAFQGMATSPHTMLALLLTTCQASAMAVHHQVNIFMVTSLCTWRILQHKLPVLTLACNCAVFCWNVLMVRNLFFWFKAPCNPVQFGLHCTPTLSLWGFNSWEWLLLAYVVLPCHTFLTGAQLIGLTSDGQSFPALPHCPACSAATRSSLRRRPALPSHQR
jgi:hypothetical protein